MSDTNAQVFITSWSGNTASELSTAQSFIRELCDLFGCGQTPPHAGPKLHV
jgi:hypothetical protein